MANKPTKSRQRILIFGGTFDPPHRAHIVLPTQVAERLGLDRIIYVPASINPLKTEPPTPAAHRLAMLELAVGDHPMVQICTLELDRPGPSYTVETLAALQERLGNEAELYLLMGADAAIRFDRWRDPGRVLELATPVVMIRPPWDQATLRERLAEMRSPTEVEWWMDQTVPVAQIDISATEIRRRLQAGEDLSDCLEPAVLAYIREHGLYQGKARRHGGTKGVGSNTI